jgi:hypothetical protein
MVAVPVAPHHAVPIYAFAEHFPVRVRPALRLSDDELFELCGRNPELPGLVVQVSALG